MTMPPIPPANPPQISRLPDWRKRLTRYLAAMPATAFAYGAHDCALFAAGAVLDMTGVDFAAAYRGRYTTLTGGLRILRKDGFADHVALAAAVLSAIHPSRAMPGDLAALDSPAGRVLGVVQGVSCYVLAADGRVGVVPLTDATGAFAV